MSTRRTWALAVAASLVVGAIGSTLLMVAEAALL